MKLADPDVVRGGRWILGLKELRPKNGIKTFRSRIEEQPIKLADPGVAQGGRWSLDLKEWKRNRKTGWKPEPLGLESVLSLSQPQA